MPNNETNKSDSSRATTPTTVSSSKIPVAKPPKSYSVNLKPIMKYVQKDGSFVDTMKDQPSFNEKNLENRIG